MSKLSTIKYLSQDELKRLFQSIEKCKAGKRQQPPSICKRNLAIFLVAYRHGLRASEVGMLRLQDFNAERGKLFCHREKNGISGEYPMQAIERDFEIRQEKPYVTWVKDGTVNL